MKNTLKAFALLLVSVLSVNATAPDYSTILHRSVNRQKCESKRYALADIFTFASSNQENLSITDEIIGGVKELVKKHFYEDKIPGLAAAVVNDRKILWSSTLGSLDTPDSSPVDDETVFSIQSMTKSFTALAVLTAVQDGLLDLDTPISKYLPNFKINSRYEEKPERHITLRHLLSNRSGIVHEAPFGNNADLRYDFKKHIESIRDTWLQFPVGYCYSYSNAGIDLAGYIVEVVSGKPYPQYLSEKVLSPLGMKNSSADFGIIKSIKNRAVGHWRSPDPLPVEFSMIPAGGLYSSLCDMTKYLMFHINRGRLNRKQILREDLMNEFHSIQFSLPGQRIGYALGLIHGDISSTYAVSHAGAGHGFFGWMGAYPELKIGVVLLTNSQQRNLTEDSFRMIIDEAIFRRYGPNPTPRPAKEEMTLLSDIDPRVMSVIGKYGTKSPEIYFENEELKISIFGNSFPIEFFDDNGEIIGLFGDNLAVKFLPPLKDQKGAMMFYHRYYGNSNWNYYFFNESPFDEPGPDKPEWGKYVGEYESVYHGRIIFKVNISRKNGYLYFGGQKMKEHLPDLFFTYDGYSVDFRNNPPCIGHLKMKKIIHNNKE